MGHLAFAGARGTRQNDSAGDNNRKRRAIAPDIEAGNHEGQQEVEE